MRLSTRREADMTLRISIFLIFTFAIGFYPASSYACSDKRIRSLADQGNTVSSIAERCDKSRSYVNRVLGDDIEEPEEEPAGAPSGTQVSGCGCWGPAMPGARIPDNRCQSGVAIAQPCNAMCQTGGLMWNTYCQ